MGSNRKQKIELLKSIRRGEKSISSLSNKIIVECWEDIEGCPGKYRESISGREADLNQLREEYVTDKKNGVRIFWVDLELESMVTGKTDLSQRSDGKVLKS